MVKGHSKPSKIGQRYSVMPTDVVFQFAHYHSLLKVDEKLASLVKAVINNEARYVAQFPYCNLDLSLHRSLADSKLMCRWRLSTSSREWAAHIAQRMGG